MIKTFLAGNFMVLAANMLVGVLVARGLGPQGRGAVALAIAWPGMAVWALTFSIPSSLSYFIPRMEPAQLPRYVMAVLLMSLVVGLVSGAILFFGARFILGKTAHEESFALIRNFMLVTPGCLVSEMAFGVILALRDNKFWSFSRAIQPVVVGVGVIPSYLAHRLTIAEVLWLNGAAVYVTALAAVCRTFAVVGIARPAERKLIKDTLAYSLKSHAASIAGMLNLRLDQLIIGAQTGTAALGVYSIAVSYANLMNPISSAMYVGVLAELSSKDAGVRNETGRRALRRGLQTMLIAAAVLLLGAPLIPLAYGKQFFGATKLASILIPGMICYGMGGITVRILLAHNRPWGASIAEVVGLAFTLPLLLILIPRYGALGAAVTSTIAYSATSLTVLLLLARQMGCSVSTLFKTIEPIPWLPRLTMRKGAVREDCPVVS